MILTCALHFGCEMFLNYRQEKHWKAAEGLLRNASSLVLRCSEMPAHSWVSGQPNTPFRCTKCLSNWLATKLGERKVNHTLFFNLPPMLILDPPHTPHPWRPGEDPESDTPSSSRILSPICRNSRALYAGIQVAESSPLPWSDEPMMSLLREHINVFNSVVVFNFQTASRLGVL